MLLKVLIVLYLFDTAMTAFAISHGCAVEVNPLYWSFHDSVTKGLVVRATAGLAVFYWLHRFATQRVVVVIVGVYGTLLMWMTGINFVLPM